MYEKQRDENHVRQKDGKKTAFENGENISFDEFFFFCNTSFFAPLLTLLQILYIENFKDWL